MPLPLHSTYSILFYLPLLLARIPLTVVAGEIPLVYATLLEVVDVILIEAAEVLQRAVLHVVDATRKLRNLQDDSRLDFAGQRVAPLDTFHCPHKSAIVCPDVAFEMRKIDVLLRTAIVLCLKECSRS